MGAGVGVGAGVGAGVGVGTGIGTAGALSWRTVTLSGPTVNETVRSAPVLGAASTRMSASPRPDDGVSVTHAALDEADHAHALCVRIAIVACPPDPDSGSDGPDTS